MPHDHHSSMDPSPSSDDSIDMGSGGSMSMSMQMYFYFGRSMTLLFSKWNISTSGGLIGAIIAMFILAVVSEALKAFREYLNYRVTQELMKSTLYKSDGKLLLRWKELFLGKGQAALLIHAIQSALHVIQVGIAYLLMLAVMTYNGWIFLAIVFGAGVGYLAFGWARYVYGNWSNHDNVECCS